jgi:hypothetical protein
MPFSQDGDFRRTRCRSCVARVLFFLAADGCETAHDFTDKVRTSVSSQAVSYSGLSSLFLSPELTCVPFLFHCQPGAV